MFILWTTLPFTRDELEDMDRPLHEMETEYSGLVPNVTVKFNNSPALRRKIPGDECGIVVRAETLAEIRTWLEQVQEFHNGGAQSINDEEMTADLDEYMQQVMNDSHPDGHVMFRE
jgi:hypothetical protein